MTRTQQLRAHIIQMINEGITDKSEVIEEIPTEIASLYSGPGNIRNAVNALWASAKAEAEEIEEAASDFTSRAEGRIRNAGARVNQAFSQKTEEAVSYVKERLPAEERVREMCHDAKPYLIGAAIGLLAGLAGKAGKR